MKKILAGILGGVVAFIWSSVVHIAPTGEMGLSTLNENEDAVMAALRGNIKQPGLYFFPGMDMHKTMTKEEEAAWTAKFKAGPSGLILIQPSGGEPMSPRQLIVEFLATVLCGLIAAGILSATVGGYFCRVTKVAMLGLFGWLAISISQWNWFEFPFSFIALEALDQIIGWLLAGFLMAKMIKPAQPQPSIPVAK